MTYYIISDGLDYKIAHVLDTHKNHVQVELIPEKIKKKLKTEHLLFQIKDTNIHEFIQKVTELTQQIDSHLLWELVNNPQNKHSIQDLALLYFGDNYKQFELTALLFNLANQFSVIHNYQNGYFSKRSLEEQQKYTAILAKQQQEKQEFDLYYNALITYTKPEFNGDIIRILNKPDKHSAIYKALLVSSKELGISQLELCHKVDLINNLADFFLQTFLQVNFPYGINYLAKPINSTDLNYESLDKNLEVIVFSVDDSNTTEIDDAFSVQITSNGFIIGIHIAAPALNPDLATIVAENISTIYYPGHKITMLPQNISNQFSLKENLELPVVSIYFTINQELNILDYQSKIEVVKIAANLRIEELEILFNQDNLAIDHGYPYEKELKILYNFANILEEKRGKPSVNNLVVDYSFKFIADKVEIKPRLRGNPIDKLVSELMILANGTWGRMLTNAFIPAIYRVKQPNYPVIMTLNPASHSGLNIDYYTWATSPLRRASDYINQRQIISLITGDKKYYSKLDPILLEVVENFDIKYTKYLEFQTKMERYWSLKYLIQENISKINATFFYKSKVQLEGIPIELDIEGFTHQQPKGSIIKLKIYDINLATLSFKFKIIS